MRREELETLLGGYATGTLTAQERTLLFEAALADQALFNALADEQALKELLDNPHARRRLLTALRAQAARPSLPRRLLAGLLPPAVRAVAGGLAVAVLAVTTVTRLLDIAPPPSGVTEDAYRAESVPGRARLEDKVTAEKKGLAPKKAERQAPMVALEKTVRQADMKQDKDAERGPAATAPQPATNLSERPPVASAPDAKTPPASPPPASAPVGKLDSTQRSTARTEGDQQAKAGHARGLFYGAGEKRMGQEAFGRAAEEAAPPRDDTRQSAPSRSDERAPAFGGPARPAVPRLGLRYGLVPRDEGPALVIEVNQRAYLYAVARNLSGATTLVYPVLSSLSDAALVEAGLRYFIPPQGALPAARVTLILSRTPLANPMAQAAPKPADKKDALLRQETTEPPLEGVAGPTVYVVETAPAPASRLSVEISVRAR